MIEKTRKKQKICSRDHKYEGSGPCPLCWPSYYKRNDKQANQNKISEK